MTRVNRAIEKGETQGFMKVLVDAESRQILGAMILGIGGDEAIHSILTAMYSKADGFGVGALDADSSNAFGADSDSVRGFEAARVEVGDAGGRVGQVGCWRSLLKIDRSAYTFMGSAASNLGRPKVR